MNEAPETNKTLRANQEHGGVRIAVFLMIAAGFIGGFLLIRVLLGRLAPDSLLLEFATVISCVGAIPIALGLAWIVEEYLKRTWSSGREIELGQATLSYEGGELEDGQEDSRSFDLTQRVNHTNWYFRLKGYPKAGRERRVSDKWYCLANQIQQDSERLITFAYMPPERAQAWIDNADLAEPFHQISLAQLYKQAGMRRWSGPNRPGDVPAEMLAGADGRYWIAERRRWDEGLELTEEDFADLLEHIEESAQMDKPE